MGFSEGIAGYAKKTKLSINQAVVSINSQISVAIIKNTPSDKGRARGNWDASLDTPSNSITSNTNESIAIANALSKAKSSAGKVFYFTNNLPYIRHLEYGMYPSPSKTGKTIGGFSIQAPQGMVRVAIKNANTALRKFRTSK